jgi:hypothetical protein
MSRLFWKCTPTPRFNETLSRKFSHRMNSNSVWKKPFSYFTGLNKSWVMTMRCVLVYRGESPQNRDVHALKMLAYTSFGPIDPTTSFSMHARWSTPCIDPPTALSRHSLSRPLPLNRITGSGKTMDSKPADSNNRLSMCSQSGNRRISTSLHPPSNGHASDACRPILVTRRQAVSTLRRNRGFAAGTNVNYSNSCLLCWKTRQSAKGYTIDPQHYLQFRGTHILRLYSLFFPSTEQKNETYETNKQ